MLLLFLCFCSSLVWANLGNKEIPNGRPPGFTPDPINLDNNYEKLLTEITQKIEETNQTKEDLLKSVTNQQTGLEKVKVIRGELENKLSSNQDSIDSVMKGSQSIIERIQNLTSQVSDKKSRLTVLLSMESSLASQFKDLEKRTAELNQEIEDAQEKSGGLELIARTPHTPGWHFTPSQGWLWTSPENYPMIYSNDREGWVFYERGSNSPWLVYDYTSQSWQAWDFE